MAADIPEASNELRSMPELALSRELEGLGLSLYTFDRNYRALRALLHFLTEHEASLKLTAIRERDKLSTLLTEVIRLVHNYAASAVSLINHTCRIHRRLYAGTGKFDDYQHQIDAEFADDPLSQFIKCLRKYCQHYRAPELSITVSIVGMEMTRSIHFQEDDLRSFDGWSAAAKRYLDEAGGNIDVAAVTSDYRNKVIDFYRWFEARIHEIHSEEFARLREKQKDLLLAMMERQIDADLSVAVDDVPYEPDGILIHVLRSDDLATLASIPIESDERWETALQMVEARLALPDALKRKIERWYVEVARTRSN